MLGQLGTLKWSLPPFNKNPTAKSNCSDFGYSTRTGKCKFQVSTELKQEILFQ
jgi:hypothetical protein